MPDIMNWHARQLRPREQSMKGAAENIARMQTRAAAVPASQLYVVNTRPVSTQPAPAFRRSWSCRVRCVRRLSRHVCGSASVRRAFLVLRACTASGPLPTRWSCWRICVSPLVRSNRHRRRQPTDGGA